MSSAWATPPTIPRDTVRLRNLGGECTSSAPLTARDAVAFTASREGALKGSPAAGVFAAGPDLLLSAVFVYTWFSPMAFDPQMVRRLTAVVLLEFVVMHSAPLSGMIALSGAARSRKAMALVGLGAFYLMFAGGFALAFGSLWPVVSFVSLMLNRLLGVLVHAVPQGAYARYLGSVWVIGAVTYILGVALTAVLPVPPLGVTPEVVAAQQYNMRGLWIDQPHRALAFGAFYFAIVGVWEIVGRVWIVRERAPSPAAR